MVVRMNDHNMTEAKRNGSVLLSLSKNRAANKLPSGIEKKHGVKRARPIRPYLDLTLIKDRLILVNFFFSFFVFFLLKKTYLSTSPKKQNAKTPKIPPVAVIAIVSKQLYPDRCTADGAKKNFNALKIIKPIILNILLKGLSQTFCAKKTLLL